MNERPIELVKKSAREQLRIERENSSNELLERAIDNLSFVESVLNRTDLKSYLFRSGKSIVLLRRRLGHVFFTPELKIAGDGSILARDFFDNDGDPVFARATADFLRMKWDNGSLHQLLIKFGRMKHSDILKKLEKVIS